VADPYPNPNPNPYLTLFVPSNTIHAPQWGLDGNSQGFVQLGCKLDFIQPLANIQYLYSNQQEQEQSP
jgi:hypothetical protein